MAYINIVVRLTLMCFFALLVGCMAGKGKTKEKPVDDIALQADLTAPLTLVPNPYDQQKITVPPDVNARFDKAVALMEAKKWADAESVLDSLTQTYPKLSGPWVNLGICIWRQGEFEAAALAFDKAIDANPLNNDAYNTYAVFAREQGNFTKAESLYKKALEVWPHSAVSHRNLGVLYDMYMGRFNEAIYHLEMSAKIAGGDDKELKGWIIDIKRRQKSNDNKQE